jgi:hypothetical protein
MPITSSTITAPASLRSDRDRVCPESLIGFISESLIAFAGIPN